MSKTINVSGLKPEQIEQIQAIIEAFKAKNTLEDSDSSQINTKTKDIDEVDILITPWSTDNYPFPTFELEVKDEYISREKIYEREENII